MSNNIGWECPKCGRCYSPITMMCSSCVPQESSIEPNTTPGIRVSTDTSGEEFSIPFYTWRNTGTTASSMHPYVESKIKPHSNKCAICGVDKWQHPIVSFT